MVPSRFSFEILLHALLLLGTVDLQVKAEPNTCQPRSQHPFLPIYHIIGNVTTDANDQVTNIESINDASAVFLYKGIYHVFHQCCQNHWDHMITKDLIHWTRLPPPIVPNMDPTGVPHPNWYDAHGSWDGSMAIPNDWNGMTEPLVIMTTVEGSKPNAAVKGTSGMAVGMAVVRPSNSSDPFLLSWKKDEANPINFTSGALTTPYDTPGQVWKNGDHWNFVILGVRYTTKDPTFHTWGIAPGPKFINAGENGGQWFSKLANQQDGSTPPLGSPGWMVNIAGGNQYWLGDYTAANETWTTLMKTAVIDSGPDANWMVGQFAGDRFMNIGWSTGGPPMAVAEYPGEDNNFPFEKEFEYTHHPQGATTSCQYTTNWEVFNETTNIYDRMPSPTNVTHGTIKFIGLFDSASECFAAVNASKEGPFHSFTYNDDTLKQPYGRHCWADTSMTWQDHGNAPHQISGRGPGFPITPPLPPGSRFTHDHLTGLRHVSYDSTLNTLISNPVKELVNLRNGTLASGEGIEIAADSTHVVSGTGSPADASTSDVVVSFIVPSTSVNPAAVGVSVLSNVTEDGQPFGGILVVVNFTKPDSNGTMHAMTSIRTLNPCGSGSVGVSQATFPILKGEMKLDIRMLVDRSVIEVFVMGGRVVFSKTYNPGTFYVPDTNVVLHSWNTATKADVDVFSMGCGWTAKPYQPNPTLDSI